MSFFFFSSRRRHTRCSRDWSSDVCSSDLDSLTRGRLPRWSQGAAFPDAGTIVLLTVRPSDRPTVALRHELAHLALRWHVGRYVPLWFEEGYAAVAAREWRSEERREGKSVDLG